MSIAVFNRCWARVILEGVTRHGVKHICIAPGSRSTPLTIEANRLESKSDIRCHTHFDERGLGFYALGLAKASHAPVVIIVTSGTAVANLYPAVIEATQSGVDLIILTADRPTHLLGSGSNQTINQTHIFSHYPIVELQLPTASDVQPASWLLTRLDHSCQQQKLTPGVIHINVPFMEPLYQAEEDEITNHPWLKVVNNWLTASQTKYWTNYGEMQNDVLIHQNWSHWRTKKGVVVVGKLTSEEAMGIANWAQTMGWILLTDIQSGVKAALPYADIWLANKTVMDKMLQADIVIQLGSQIISKRINQFLSRFKNEFWLVDNSNEDLDQNFHRKTRFKAKAHHWLRSHPPLRQSAWLLEPLALSRFCKGFIEEQIGTSLNEASLTHYITRVLSSEGSLFLGNSLFVRLMDALSELPDNYPVYTNRGSSGIDGLIATATGVAVASHRPLVALLGDISALHDLNSFSLLQNVSRPTIIFVINNDGGAIFDMLPVENKVKERYYRLNHGYEFSHIAAMFDVHYAKPYTWADLNSVLKMAYGRKEATIIEIKVNPHDGSQVYKNLIEQLADAVIER